MSSTTTGPTEVADVFRVGLGSAVAGVALFSLGPALIAGSESSGLTVGFWRIWLSVAVIGAIVMAQREMEWKCLRLTCGAGLSFGLATSFFYSAVQITSVANATLIAVLQPIPLLVAGRIFFGENATRRDVLLVVLAVAGSIVAVVAAGSAATGDLGGDLLALAALLFAAVYFVLGKKARQQLGTLPFMFGMWVWAGTALTPVLLVSGKSLMPVVGTDWWLIAGIAVLPGTGHALTNFAHGKISLSIIGALQLITPVGGSLIALWFLDQTVTIVQAVAMVFVIATLTVYTVQQSTRSHLVTETTTAPP
jgi:drug/metabolite transporter (DMT)-like permease